MMSQKFKFLRNECVTSSWVLINILNVYDKRGIEFFFKSWEEISALKERPTTISELHKEIVPICVIIKSTPNFLMKLSESELLDNLKTSLSSKGLNKIMEIEDEINFDLDSFIQDVLFLCNN